MKKSTAIILIIIFLLIIGGGLFWYFLIYLPGLSKTPIESRGPDGFTPLTSTSTIPKKPTAKPVATTTIPVRISTTTTSIPIPRLRLLSNTPTGGYGASTTASTTVVRWIDRGRGNILEAYGDSLNIKTLSNTILPRMYESVWNKNITALIGSVLQTNTEVPIQIYAKLTPTIVQQTNFGTSTATTSTLSNITPFELKGKNLPEDIINYAVSPKGDRIFMLIKDNSGSSGFIANFDGSSVVKIFDTPMTQVNVEWPEESTLAITTKGLYNKSGFLYFVNTKNGSWKKIVGPVVGLSTVVSKDAKYVLFSKPTSDGSISTSIYDVQKRVTKSTNMKTLADKCAWGNFYKEIVYCAIPSEISAGLYPDDWYLGAISFVDKIWQMNVLDESIKIVSPITDQSDRVIDVFNIGLDKKDDFMFFMNKDDLSFWSLDLLKNN